MTYQFKQTKTMSFNRQNRQALIEELNNAKKSLDIQERTFMEMKEQSSEVDQLWQHVGLEVARFRIKAIEKAIIDNNPNGLDWDFTND